MHEPMNKGQLVVRALNRPRWDRDGKLARIDFLDHICECGLTRGQHMGNALAEDHSFEPVEYQRRIFGGAAVV